LLRLLSFSLILGIIPTVFIGLFSYFNASQDIENKVYESNLQVLTQTQMRVEQLLKSLEMAAIQYVNSPIVKEAAGASVEADDFTVVRDLSNGLLNLETSAVIHQASLINFDREWVVNLNIWKSLSESESAAQFRELAQHPNSIFWQSAGEVVRFVHKIPIIPKGSEPKGMLVLDIKKEELGKLLFNGKQLGRAFILDEQGDDFLSSEVQKESRKEIYAKITEMKDKGSQEDYFNAYINEEEMGVIYLGSTYNGWTYVAMVSVSEITRQTKQIAIVTLLVCGFMLAVVLLLALYGSKRMYSPIRRIFEFTKRAVEDIDPQEGNKDELRYIQEGIQSLSASRKKLENQVKGQYDHLKEFFVLKLLTGQMTEEDYLYRSVMYGFPTGWQRIAVLSLQIDNFQESRYMEQDKELLLFAINNIVGELLPSHTRFSPILLGSTQVTLVTVTTEDQTAAKSAIYQIAEKIQEHVSRYLQLQVSIGISSPASHLSDAVKAYGESLSALKSRIHLGNDLIIHYEDLDKKEGGDSAVYSHLRVMEEQLVQALRGGQLEQAEEVLKNYLSTVLDKEAYLHEHPLLLLQLIGHVMRLVQEQGIAVNKVINSEVNIEQFFRLRTREEILYWFRTQLFEPIVQQLTEKAETYHVNIAERLVQVIHARYEQELTLESLAAEMNFHPVYISRVFKKELGVPFSEYLSSYRMRMAKLLLETTSLKVSEIGEKLQYRNISAFIRSFQRAHGITPGKYRERLEKQ
jgi:two-component system, response regulator YesN